MSIPSLDAWAFENWGKNSVNNDVGTLYIKGIKTNTYYLSLLHKPAPPTPYIVKVELKHDLASIPPNSTPTGNRFSYGVGFRDVNGKLVTLLCGRNYNSWFIQTSKWTNATTAYGSPYKIHTAGQAFLFPTRSPNYLAVEDDGEVFNFWWSIDGLGVPGRSGNWNLFDAQPNDEFLAPGFKSILVGIQPYEQDVHVEIIDWEEIAPTADFVGENWIMASFEGALNNMNVLSSKDCSKWKLQGHHVLPTGRDPSIMKHLDGKWYVAHTLGGLATDHIGLAMSEDRVSWTLLEGVHPNIPGMVRYWAPEWFIDPLDGSVHLLVSSNPDVGSYTNFQTYELHPLNAELTEWSEAEKIAITGESNVIDPYLVYKNGVYYLWYKNQTTTYICLATSSTLLGPYTPIKTGNWMGFGNLIEGMCVVDLGDRWRLTFDRYQNSTVLGQLFQSDSFDNFETWTPPIPMFADIQLKHATIIPGS
jgi:hypothetical protein